MNLTIIQDSTIDQEPLSVDEVKAYLRLDTSADDSMLAGLIVAARLEAENEQCREFSQKQYKMVLDYFPVGSSWIITTQFNGADGNARMLSFTLGDNRIDLLDPLVRVDSFTYTKSDGTVVTMTENTDYVVDVDRHPGRVCPASNTSWPSVALWPSSAVQITFTAGFTRATTPGNIKQGMMMLASQWFEGRIPFEAIRAIAELPFSVTALLRTDKHWRF